jgi:starch phosphorylase
VTPSKGPAFLDPYEYGPVHLFGKENGLFERHLLYDNVIDRTAADARDRFEAFARAVRDILSQRWVSTESAYDRLNLKRVYYLSMEFLIGRSLANNRLKLRAAIYLLSGRRRRQSSTSHASASPTA